MIHPPARSPSRLLVLALLAGGLPAGPAAADSYPRQTAVDVLHYDVAVELRDGSDLLAGTTRVRFEALREGVDRLQLDLEGLTVEAASSGERPRPFRHESGRLEVELERPLARGEIGVVEVRYHGRPEETRALLDGRRLTRWSQSIPIPTYCMVIGVAEFAVEPAGVVAGVPLSIWAYPQDRAAAARRFDRSALVLQ